MARFGYGWFVAFLAGFPTACLLYTDPINMPPVVTLTAPAQVHRGTTAIFSAHLDDDQAPNQLSVEWRRAATCPDAADAQVGTLLQQGGEQLSVAVTSADPFCVWVFARDALGASGFSAKNVIPENRIPRAAIDVVTPESLPDGHYERYSRFHLSAAASIDEDPDDELTFEWTLRGPGDVPIAATTCTTGAATTSGDEICFLATGEGAHQVQLRATDESGAAGDKDMVLTVNPDRPPCIRRTLPSHSLSLFPGREETVTLNAVEIDDDGEPYSGGGVASNASFIWTWRLEGTEEFNRSPYDDLPFQIVPSGWFRPGNTVEFRVRYLDRNPRDLSTCNENAPTCDLGTGCHQWVTWKVVYR